MHRELQQTRLRVVLVPSLFPEIAAQGGKIRRVEEENPDWYQAFCGEYLSNRRKPRTRKHPDTLIKRQLTLNALAQMAAGVSSTLYCVRLLPYVKAYAETCRLEQEQTEISHAYLYTPQPLTLANLVFP